MHKIIDRDAFAVTHHQGAADADKAYWTAASRDERFAAVEMQRQIAYGYQTAPRIQRVFERIGNLNASFDCPQLYRQPDKRSIARCLENFLLAMTI